VLILFIFILTLFALVLFHVANQLQQIKWTTAFLASSLWPGTAVGLCPALYLSVLRDSEYTVLYRKKLHTVYPMLYKQCSKTAKIKCYKL